MAGDGAQQGQVVLYLTACDTHARSREGTPMVAGTRFTAPKGYPALAWGCGPLYHLNPKLPRWLVLEAQQVESGNDGARVFEASIMCDGSRNDALRYLHEHGAGGMPYLARRRRGGAHAVLSTGSVGEIESGPHSIVAAGEASQLQLDLGATAAVGRGGQVKAAEFARLVIGDGGTATTERFSAIAAGMNATVEAGDGALVVAGSMSRCKVGAGGRVLIDSAGELDLGVRAVGIGRTGTRFRGGEGAQFVILDVVDDGAVSVVTARVGEAGVVSGRWYHVKNGHFEPTDT
ncbi:hypothetical protein [Rhodanobacter sp. FW106-PBR-R2A-1-13]|uniref:hypothetical protein n=1 Tax=Rhodanobacter sp. FW106-PBR-R2A-1-13 TaxID=3454845 RepID=UPI0034E5FE17